MNLQELIDNCVSLKKGNNEFVLNYCGSEWSAGIGNPTTCVMLNEASPEFHSGWHETAEAAVAVLLEQLRQHDGVVPDPRTPEKRAHDEMIAAMSDDELREWNRKQAENAKQRDIIGGYIRPHWIAADAITAQSTTFPEAKKLIA